MGQGDIQAGEWNAFLRAHQHVQFLQSWEWGMFHESLGRAVSRTVLCDHTGQFSGIGQCVDLPIVGKFFYTHLPHGPVAQDSRSAERTLIRVLRATRERGAVFLRIEPLANLEQSELITKNSKRVPDVQPSHTRILDLSCSREELLSLMHPKTRYNIGLAQKKGVTVSSLSEKSPEERTDLIHAACELLKETAGRDRFFLHPIQYYQSLLETFPSLDTRKGADSPAVELLYASTEQGIRAIAIVLFFGDTATYLYGASSGKFRNLMAPYALHWHALSLAQKAGCRWYDFWGIAPDDSENHPLAGVTRFKEGFGGERMQYPGTYDIVLKPFEYRIYQVARSIHSRTRRSTDRTRASEA